MEHVNTTGFYLSFFFLLLRFALYVHTAAAAARHDHLLPLLLLLGQAEALQEGRQPESGSPGVAGDTAER